MLFEALAVMLSWFTNRHIIVTRLPITFEMYSCFYQLWYINIYTRIAQKYIHKVVSAKCIWFDSCLYSNCLCSMFVASAQLNNNLQKRCKGFEVIFLTLLKQLICQFTNTFIIIWFVLSVSASLANKKPCKLIGFMLSFQKLLFFQLYGSISLNTFVLTK